MFCLHAIAVGNDYYYWIFIILSFLHLPRINISLSTTRSVRNLKNRTCEINSNRIERWVETSLMIIESICKIIKIKMEFFVPLKLRLHVSCVGNGTGTCTCTCTMWVLHLAAIERTNEIIICNNRSIINYKSGNKLSAKPMIPSKYANNHKSNEHQQYLHTASYKMKTNMRSSIAVPQRMPSQRVMNLFAERCEWIKRNSANHAIC